MLFDGASDATRVTIADNQAIGTIINDDTATLSINDVTMNEGDTGNTAFVFTITSDLTSSKDLEVTVNTNDLLEAIGGTDYTTINTQPAVITAGADSTTVTVNITGDQIVEIDETFTVDLSAALFDGGSDATRVVISDGSGLGTIVNDDVAAISIDDVTLSEGDSGTTAFAFTISSNLFSSKDLAVTVDTNDLLEAIGGTDYTAIVAQPAIITAGTNTTTVNVNVVGDEIVEIDETFTVDLSAALFDGNGDSTRVIIADDSGRGTIVNDDTAAVSINDLSLSEGDAGNTTFTFTISSDLVSSKDLAFTVNTNDLLEASGGTDYTAVLAQTAVITAGSDFTSITVDVLGDQIVEIDETFTVDVSGALFGGSSDSSRVTIVDATGLGTIVNDDSASLSINDVTLSEGDSGQTEFVFTITSDLESSKDIDVTIQTNDLLEAVGNTDYVSLAAQPAVITAGTNSTTVTVNVIGDQIVEVDETFTVDVSDALFDGNDDATRVTIGDGSGLGTIVNDDTASLTIEDVTATEGDSGTTSFTFTVASDLTASKDLSVVVDTNDLLEAVGGTDYTSIDAQTVVISAGTDATTINVEVLGDEIVEIDETFTVDLSSALFDGVSDATRVGIADGTALGTIINDDTASITIDDVTLAEGDTGTTEFVFVISSDHAASKDLDFTINTSDLVEAVGGSDYTSIVDQSARISVGNTSTTITVDVSGDSLVEVDETFAVQLSAALFGDTADSTRLVIADDTGQGTIVNDDTATLTIDDVSLSEADNGSTIFTFTISSDLASSKDISVTVNTNDLLEAVGGTDYTSIVNQSAVIDAGENSTTVSVSVLGDQIVEVDETFTLDLSSERFDGSADATRVLIGDSSGLGTIVNDDTATLTIDDVALSEGDTGTTVFEFTISSDLLSSKDLGVTVNTIELLEAVIGTDFDSIVGQSAVISAGSDSTTIAINVLGDQIVEVDETFTVELSAAIFDGALDETRVGIGDDSGLGTIINDDTATLSIDDVSLIEGNTGTTDFVFTISSDAISSKDLTAVANSADLFDAVAGLDYQGITNQTITIDAGSTMTTLTVNATGDEIVEFDETFGISLSDARFNDTSDVSRVVLGDNDGIGTILNDDQASITIDDVTIVEGDSGVTEFVFTISSDLAASRDLGVVVSAEDLGDLIGGADLVDVVSQSATIESGDVSTTITIDVLGDTLVELDEVFEVDVTAATFDGQTDVARVLISDNQGVGTIVNDDLANISINDVATIEGDAGRTNVVFTISMDAASAFDTSLTVRSQDGFQAIENADYVGIPSQDLVIAAGQTSAIVTVELIGDSIVEVDETFVVQLSDALFGTTVDETRIRISDDTGVGTITNDDTAVITIDDVTAIEGDIGTTEFVFTIRQDEIASLDTSVVVNTSDLVRAVAGIDYDSVTNQVITIAAGSRSSTVTVNVIGETLVEATETFRVDISDAQFGGSIDASRITIGVAIGTGTILNDDAGDFLVEDLVVNESDATAELTISLANPIDADTTLVFSLDANPDIQNLTNQVTFRAGSSQSQSIQFSIEDDILVEGTETYIGFFELMTRADGTDVTASVATSIEIVDNDRATFDLADMTVDESAGTITLTVNIDAPFDIDATFDLSTPPENDISFVDPTVTFNSNSTETQSVTITVNDDQIVELDEVINISLVPQTDLGDRDIDVSDVGALEIIENDSATFSVEDLSVGEDDGTVLFTVSVDNPIDIDTTFSILLGATDDITALTQTITFAAGSNQSQSFSLELVDDSLQELTEQIGALAVLETDLGLRSVASPEGASITIQDDDTPDFIRELNENILITSVPILVPTTAPGGTATIGGDSGVGGSTDAGTSNSGNSSTTTTQAPADTAADGSSDSGGEGTAGSESLATIGVVGQDSATRISQSSVQSFSSSDGSTDYQDASSNQAKNISTNSEFESDKGELLFHVVLPNGKLGKELELDIELLNEDDASLFERFRGLPTDVYRVLYREPGSDTFQQLFEIHVVDGKIETILYSRDAAVEEIDPADDMNDVPINSDADGGLQGLPDTHSDEASNVPALRGIGRFAFPVFAATMAFSASSQTNSRDENPTQNDPMPKMDRVSRTVRKLIGAIRD